MADSVTRYEVWRNIHDRYDPRPDPDGEWCRYSDVAPIVERCKKLEAVCKRIDEWNSETGGGLAESLSVELRAALSEKGEP